MIGMSRHRFGRVWRFLASGLVLGCGLAATPAATAQALRPSMVEEWAEVVTVTPRWIVLQNRDGQQFPLSVESIRLFVMRWPISIDRISPGALLEATGFNRGSNLLATPHIDVYEGAARSLVAPGVLLISPGGMVSRPIDFLFNPEVYGAPFPGFDAPIQSGNPSGPQLTHVVGPIVSWIPLRIGLGGNNVMTVLPAASGVPMTQVTPGSIGLVKPGDLVYFAARQARPESLVLDQLVVYKSTPLDLFAP